ncbi:MAG: hypothetical protein AB2A00_06980 [Myxococcota bacterium]
MARARRSALVVATLALTVLALQCRREDKPFTVGKFQSVFATTGGQAISEAHLNLMGGGTLAYFFDPNVPQDLLGLRDVTSMAMIERDRGLVCYTFTVTDVPKDFWSKYMSGRSCLLMKATPEVLEAFGGPPAGTVMILDRINQVWWQQERPFNLQMLSQAVAHHRVEGTRQAIERFKAAQDARLRGDGGTPVMPREPTEPAPDAGLVVPTR